MRIIHALAVPAALAIAPPAATAAIRNVILLMTQDVGLRATSVFGGEIPAANGDQRRFHA